MRYIEIIENNNEDKTKFIIYLLRNKINNKIYIGQTIQSLRERLRKHTYLNTQIITKAINKYGCENFQCEILYYANNIKELNEKEKHYIEVYDSMNLNIGYNLRPGGMNYHITDETKKKLSDANKGKIISDEIRIKISNSTTGENNHFYGKKHTDETKQKMSDAHENRVISNETKQKMSISQLGRTHSDETKLKMREKQIGVRHFETPVITIDKDFNILQSFKNVPECAEYLNLNVRTVYDAYKKLSFSKKCNVYILKEKTFDEDLLKLNNL